MKEDLMAEADEQQYDLARLVSFSDGVFGFAITLLITTIPFTLDLPQLATNQQTVQQLVRLLPQVYAYVFSFYIIGNYWVVHHRMFRHITRSTTTLLWINLTLLLFIVFLPFPTALLGRYGSNSVVVALYAAVQAVISGIHVIMEWYVTTQHLDARPLSQHAIRYTYLRGLIPCAIFALSIAVAFYNVTLAKIAWIALLVIRPLVLRRPKPEEA
jgi:uncharacterized membrane protein